MQENASDRCNTALQRNLGARHLTMLAVGGSIGTGLFLTSGQVIALAGPGGALVAYALIGTMVYFLMSSLGELAAFLPVTGSFATYGSRFIEPGFGFALGWNYWLNWTVTVAIDLVTTAQIVRYWFPEVPLLVSSLLAFALILTLNAISVRGFGEAEYWFACIKVSAIGAFLLTGTRLILSALYGSKSDSRLFFNFADAPFVGGWLSVVRVGLLAAFAFQGTELIGIAAGECTDPEKTIPKAIRSTFWRILTFYLGSLVVIGCLIPYTDPNLSASQVSDIAISPFTLVFARYGYRQITASIMNFVILTAVLSAANSGLYASTRMLFSLAQEQMAPASLKRLNTAGIPLAALCVTALVIFGFFVLGSVGGQAALLLLSSMAGFIAWLGIAWSHYRFRAALMAQNVPISRLPYRACGFPWGLIYASVLTGLCILGQSYDLYCQGAFRLTEVLMLYSGLVIFAGLWWAYRTYTQTSRIPLTSVDLMSVLESKALAKPSVPQDNSGHTSV